MNKIVIDGIEYTGQSVSVYNGVLTIDGVTKSAVSGVVEIRIVEGILQELRTDASVSCKEVQGNVNAGSSVSCRDVDGDVNAGSSVSCGRVGGSVKAGSSVVYRK